MQLNFRPVAAADLPLLADWIGRPHWQDWWGDVAEEISYIADMLEGRDSTRPFLFLVDGVVTGYIQVWVIADQRVEPWLTEAPWLLDLPDDAVGVDLSIADPNGLSQGVGTAVLTAFVERLRDEGHKTIIIDPHPANLRAVRAYEKAGFRLIPQLSGRTGDYLLMQHHPEEIGV